MPRIKRKRLDLLYDHAIAAVGIARIRLAPRLVLVGRTAMDGSAQRTSRLIGRSRDW
jgi:hypothetical protein